MNNRKAGWVMAATCAACVVTGCASKTAEEARGASGSSVAAKPSAVPSDPAQAAVAARYQQQADAEHQAAEQRAQGKTGK